MKTYWGSAGIDPRILNLGIRWRWVVSFTPRPLYLRGKSTRHPLDSKPGGLQSWSGSESGGGEKNPIITPAGNWTPVVQPVA
jgi:hypothetical protein